MAFRRRRLHKQLLAVHRADVVVGPGVALAPHRVTKRVARVAVLAALAGLTVAATGGATGRVARAAVASTAATNSTIVMLLTGDRVRLSYAGNGRPLISVDPAQGRRSVGFETLTVGGHVYVIPVDAAPFLDAPLDLSLFDVSALAAGGDSSTPATLQVTQGGGTASDLPGITVGSDGRATETTQGAAAFSRALHDEWSARRQGLTGTLFSGIDRVAVAGAARRPAPGVISSSGQPTGKLYTLTVRAFDRDGRKDWADLGIVYNIDDGDTFLAGQAFFDGTLSFSVPAGTYEVAALIEGAATPADASASFVTAPEVKVGPGTNVVILDARKANPVTATVPDPATPLIEQMTVQRDPAQGSSFSWSFTSPGSLPMYAAPTRATTVGQLYFYSSFRLGDGDGRVDRYLYDLQFDYKGPIPASLAEHVERSRLAVVDASYHSSVPDRKELEARLGLAPWQVITSSFGTELRAPLRRTEYILPQPDLYWLQTVTADPQDNVGDTNDRWRGYAPGEKTTAEWMAQPQPPGVERETEVPQPCPVCRSEDTIATLLFPYADPAGHTAMPDGSVQTTLKLYEDGRLIDSQPSPFAQFAVSPSPAVYQLQMDVSRDAGWWPTSSRTHTIWTFPSTERPPDALPPGWTCGGKGSGGGGRGGTTGGGGGGGGCSVEPLLFASYDTHAGLDDVVAAGSAATIDVAVARQPYAPPATVGDLSFDVSFDDGASWLPASVTALGGGRFRASYSQPALVDTTGFASLRISVADSGESRLEQTIIRAYPLAPLLAAGPGGGDDGGDRFRSCSVPVAPPYAACMSIVAPGSGLGSAARSGGYGPAEIADAYKLPAGAGAGQTVAIVDAYDDPQAEADLAGYRSTHGLPPCTSENGCFRKVNEHGQEGPLPIPDPGWGLEISLDLDAVSAACPACSILLVEADSPSLLDLGPAVDTAVALGADAVSNSYGSRGEFSGEQYFERYYKHDGLAVTVSSGDYGYGNGRILVGSVSYPGASQYVTSVGGTSLARDASARGWTETAWKGSTSGCSAYIHKPGWQKDTLCDKRTVADVSAVADPKTGLAVYDTFGYDGWLVVGGTSLSSPIVASIYAMTGDTTDIRYAGGLYRASSGLFDVIEGSNGSCGGSYLCTGVPGYDGPTGLGSPDGLTAFTSAPPGR
jgi:hypothetical protein